MAAALTITGWFIEPLISELIKKIGDYLKSQLDSVRNSGDDIRKLEQALAEVGAIASMVDEIPNRSIIDPEPWLRKVTDATNEADHILNELGNPHRHDQDEQARGGIRSMGLVSRITYGTSNIFKLFRVREIVKKLEAAKDDLIAYLKLVELKSHQMIQPAMDTNFLDSGTELVSRVMDINDIVSLLIRPYPIQEMYERRHLLPVLAIIGDRDVGKTRLAKLVRDKCRTARSFDLIVGFQVSDTFDEIMLMKGILNSAMQSNETFEDIVSFDVLSSELKKVIGRRSFLVILDDVCYDMECGKAGNQQRWSAVCASLRNCGLCGMILITTRLPLVAEMFHATNLVLLETLSQTTYRIILESSVSRNIYPFLFAPSMDIQLPSSRFPVSSMQLESDRHDWQQFRLVIQGVPLTEMGMKFIINSIYSYLQWQPMTLDDYDNMLHQLTQWLLSERKKLQIRIEAQSHRRHHSTDVIVSFDRLDGETFELKVIPCRGRTLPEVPHLIQHSGKNKAKIVELEDNS